MAAPAKFNNTWYGNEFRGPQGYGSRIKRNHDLLGSFESMTKENIYFANQTYQNKNAAVVGLAVNGLML